MPLTLCFKTYETNYRLETTGVHATVLTVKTGKRTTGIGADTKISIGQYPIPDTSIGLTLLDIVTAENDDQTYLWITSINNFEKVSYHGPGLLDANCAFYWTSFMVVPPVLHKFVTGLLPALICHRSVESCHMNQSEYLVVVHAALWLAHKYLVLSLMLMLLQW